MRTAAGRRRYREPCALNTGLYTAHNVAAVYEAVLDHARIHLCRGESVILDGTWRDSRQRQRAHDLADQTASTMFEFVCTATEEVAATRVQTRTNTTSDATPEIAKAFSGSHAEWHDAHRIDTGRPLADSVAEAQELCCRSV